MNDRQMARLRELLQGGPREYGWSRAKIWTAPMVKELIGVEFRIAYHSAHVSRLMREMGFGRRKLSSKSDVPE